MAVAAALIRELRPGLTAEEVREAMTAVRRARGDLPEDVIVWRTARSRPTATIAAARCGAGEPVVVDIWPQRPGVALLGRHDADVRRGRRRPDDELAEYWRLAASRSTACTPMVRAGADANAIFRASCEPFIAAGKPTQITKAPGEVLRDGYFHWLGHGVGLEVHERPHLGRLPDTLVAGDVITLEPGCYRQGYGGCRLEDLVLVTEDGARSSLGLPV